MQPETKQQIVNGFNEYIADGDLFPEYRGERPLKPSDLPERAYRRYLKISERTHETMYPGGVWRDIMKVDGGTDAMNEFCEAEHELIRAALETRRRRGAARRGRR